MRTLLVLITLFSLSGCSVSHYLTREIKKSPVLSQQHTGVSINQLTGSKAIASYQSDKYFNPASNTKLFSFYAGLCALGDSLPGLEYLEWGELLIIRGTGDPSLFHPDLPQSGVIDFLKSRNEQIFFSPTNFQDERFGPGWAWSDYNDDYQPEISPMPVHGNIARFTGLTERQLRVKPKIWEKSLLPDTSVVGIKREEFQNVFHYGPKPLGAGKTRDIPVRMTDQLTVQLLSDALKKEVKLIHIPLNIDLHTVKSIPSDSLYTRMMQVSDNMLAEQLMLLYASANGLPLNTDKAIDHMKKNYLSDMPDNLVWKDGSGLSRYNLFTPRSIAVLLQKIYAKVPQDRLFKILPNGGATGSLKNMFKGEAPFIFAKTGSFSNNFNLSGYLVTKKGKTLVFSFMNNNFTRPGAEVRKEVERILTEIHRKF
jgi:D-alanyl-D-alanine carboxypeptidase/D-alanyl-D-alanine-endopeptidase (penicillin-binding protein 4)